MDMETVEQTHQEVSSKKISSQNSDRLFNEATTILSNDAHLSKSKKDSFLFYLGVIALTALTISVAITDPIYNAKFIAGSGIILGLLMIRRFDLK